MSSSSLQTGQIFAGRYRISHLIGAGGMAEVYAAKHTLTDHAVAVKLLRPGDESASKGYANFALEARIDARVGSPHIVRVQDAGVDQETGTPYLVLELLRGKTLARLIHEQSDGRLRIDQTLDILRQVALGLFAAHAYSVVHRDLKPENIFVTDSSIVKILDFGIAKLLDASNHVTQEVRGTPYYMAAEQANGERVSVQTDIWALGLLAYRALTGRIYWRSANQPGASPTLAKIVYEITVAPRDPPSVRLREQGIDLRLPGGFDAWFLRCIEIDPSRRFSSAVAAVEELTRAFENWAPGVLAGSGNEASQPVEPQTRPTRTYPELASPREPGSVPGVMTDPRTRTRRPRLVAGAVVALSVLASAGFWLQRGPPRAETAASELAASELAAAEVAAPPGVSSAAEPAVSSPSTEPATAGLPAALAPPSFGETGAAPPPSTLEVGGAPATPAAPAAREASAPAVNAPSPARRRAPSQPVPREHPDGPPLATPGPNAVDIYGLAPLQLSRPVQLSRPRAPEAALLDPPSSAQGGAPAAPPAGR